MLVLRDGRRKYWCFGRGVSVSIDIFADDDDVVSLRSRLSSLPSLFAPVSLRTRLSLVNRFILQCRKFPCPLRIVRRFTRQIEFVFSAVSTGKSNNWLSVLQLNRARVTRWICAYNTDQKSTTASKPKSTNSNSKWWPEHWCGLLRNDPSMSGIACLYYAYLFAYLFITLRYMLRLISNKQSSRFVCKPWCLGKYQTADIRNIEYST